MFYNSQAYFTKFTHYIIGLLYLKSLKFSRQFMDYFLGYPDIKLKKHATVKKFPVHYIFWD